MRRKKSVIKLVDNSFIVIVVVIVMFNDNWEFLCYVLFSKKSEVETGNYGLCKVGLLVFCCCIVDYVMSVVGFLGLIVTS